MERRFSKKISRRDFLKVAGATGATVALGELISRRGISAPKEVVIGCIYPLTGAFARPGLDAKQGIETVLDLVNNRHDLDIPLAKTEGLPNLGGAKVRAIFADSQGNNEKGLSEAERLISMEKVVALFGSFNSGVTNTASQVAERMGIPFLCPEASAPSLTQRGFKWFFHSAPGDIQYTRVQFEFMKDFEKTKNIKIRTLGLTHDDSIYGSDTSRLQREMAKEFGYEIVADVRFRMKATSLVSEVQILKSKNPDVWLQTCVAIDSILFVKTTKELDYNPKMVISQGGTTDTDYTKTVGKEAEGILCRTPFSTDLIEKNPLAVKVNQILKKYSGGQDFYDFSARAFTGFYILCDAINRAGSTDPMAIQKALRETDIPPSHLIMPWDGVKFGPDGRNMLGKALMVQMQEGANRTVWPWKYATRSLIYPIPKWSERK
jgi:branched-chain amino acid transport system substrate-binding protein